MLVPQSLSCLADRLTAVTLRAVRSLLWSPIRRVVPIERMAFLGEKLVRYSWVARVVVTVFLMVVWLLSFTLLSRTIIRCLLQR